MASRGFYRETICRRECNWRGLHACLALFDLAGPPAPDPASCAILFRSLRYSLRDSSLIENGTDLLATRDPACFWFRHRAWDGGKWIDRCEFAPRNEAVVFIREQFTKPGLFSGWNPRGLREFLPEVYGKKEGERG